MLYFYKTISPQRIESLYLYLDYYFTRLFQEIHPVYDRTYYIHADFVDIVDEYNNQIEDKLSALLDSYMALQPNEKQTVQDAYNNNNNIEAICNNTARPYKFNELPLSVQTPIKELYDSNGVLYRMLTSKNSYKKIKDKCGTLKEHFEKFRQLNKYSICPFCGMENLITNYDLLKNEYDHYISKGDYPFCSINFNNLVPICDYCNKSGNKGQKDIPYIPQSNPLVQEELYYPYANNIPNHEVILSIQSPDTDLSDPNSWVLNFDCIPTINSARKDRWLEIYNIENRYKSKIAFDSYTWKDRIIIKYNLRCKKHGDSFDRFREDILDDFADYKKWNNGIIMKCFDEFIINDPNCESYLSGNFIL